MKQKTIHLVGAQETNYPWGVECRIIRALEALGHHIISTDFRKHRATLRSLLAQKADIVLVCRGENIPPELIQNIPCPTALWYAELLGTKDATDADANARRKQLAYNGPAFDYVFLHDSTGIAVCKDMGCQNVSFLATAAVDPTINKKMETEKQYDISFIGSITPRRKVFLDAIREKANLHIAQIWDQDEINHLYNQSKIVLNIHLSELLNTETRLCEVLGAGAFLLTEEISMKDFLVDKRHLVSFRNNSEADCIAKIEYYLSHDQEREKIAEDGYHYVNTNHSFVQRMKEFLDYIDPHIKKKMWHFGLGIPLDRDGRPTRYLPDFYRSVETSLEKLYLDRKPVAEPSIGECQMKNSRKNLRIFAAFSHVNWEDYNLQPALESFGEVIRFRWNFHDQYTPQWHATEKAAMNRRLLEAVQQAHAIKPVDVFSGYLSGRTVFPETIKAIGRLGIPTLNISLDDRMKFVGLLEPTGHTGQVDIASAFSLCWTSTQNAIKQYDSVGAKAIFLPEGANPEVYRKLDLPFDIDVSFIGQCYGKRPEMIEKLKNRGIAVQTFGRGWPSGEISVEQMVEIYNRSSINIGFAMVGDCEDVYCLKGRDFEVPMSCGLYFTQYHPELTMFYKIGEEIVCYHDMNDLIEKIVYYLDHPEKAQAIRTAGYKRALKEHTWVQRFRRSFEEIGLFKDESNSPIGLQSIITQKMTPSEIKHMLEKGEALYKAGNILEAKNLFEKVLSVESDYVEACNNLGVILFQDGELNSAIKLFSKVLSVDQDHKEAMENLGRCYESKGDYREALQWLERSLCLNEKSPEILNCIGNCYIHLGDIDNATETYAESLQLDGSQDIIRNILKEISTLQKCKGKTLVSRKKNDLHKINDVPFCFSEYFLYLFEKYAQELRDIEKIERQRYNRDIFPTTGQYDLFESQILYMLVRDTQPESMIEFSSNCGYSTLFTTIAMRRNGKGHLYSFEIVPAFLNIAKRNASNYGFSDWVSFFLGDVKETLVPFIEGHIQRSPDMVFIDSDHSYPFAEWYIANLFPVLKKGTLVHVHDVLPPNAAALIDNGGSKDKVIQSGENKAIHDILQRNDYVDDEEYIYLHDLTFCHSKWLDSVKRIYPNFVPYRQGKDYVNRRMNRDGILTEWNATLWFRYVKKFTSLQY